MESYDKHIFNDFCRVLFLILMLLNSKNVCFYISVFAFLYMTLKKSMATYQFSMSKVKQLSLNVHLHYFPGDMMKVMVGTDSL